MKQNSSKIKGSEFQHWPHAKGDASGKKHGMHDPHGYGGEHHMLSPGANSKIRDLTGTPDGFLPASITNGKKIRSDKYMVL